MLDPVGFAGRITPAHAGKSIKPAAQSALNKDHPRPCGEKGKDEWAYVDQGGSPPPMRGKVSDRNHIAPRYRITPAHAGKRSHAKISACAKKDHPRPCGEKLLRRVIDARLPGSPPPMRGKGVQVGRVFCEAGITPAHAGKSGRRQGLCRAHRDHPRPCGEKHVTGYVAREILGSPPPMRGKAFRHLLLSI